MNKKMPSLRLSLHFAFRRCHAVSINVTSTHEACCNLFSRAELIPVRLFTLYRLSIGPYVDDPTQRLLPTFNDRNEARNNQSVRYAGEKSTKYSFRSSNCFIASGLSTVIEI